MLSVLVLLAQQGNSWTKRVSQSMEAWTEEGIVKEVKVELPSVPISQTITPTPQPVPLLLWGRKAVGCGCC